MKEGASEGRWRDEGCGQRWRGGMEAIWRLPRA